MSSGSFKNNDSYIHLIRLQKNQYIFIYIYNNNTNNNNNDK